ncbi:MAG: DNA/RNA nuclease SfsA [Oscillospiraceae bacterium]|nr:DNA/RNA nuclease SfsA [Oscillospiraceae bacterium]
MKYSKVIPGTFLSRPNRFIAHVLIDGKEEIVHVKNTGRCRELLLPGATVYLYCAPEDSPRKTKYDLIAVKKGDRLINMDSQAPNAVAEEWLRKQYPNADIRREVFYGASRFDFRIIEGEKTTFLEVKGVTLEKENIAMFPDAPTERGLKHIKELISCKKQGYEAAVLFVIKMKEIRAFRPNDLTHPAFGDALRAAQAAGVRILAMDCIVTPDSLTIDSPVKIDLESGGNYGIHTARKAGGPDRAGL